MPELQRKILRDYHQMNSALTALNLGKKVGTALTDKTIFPDTFWGVKLVLLLEFLAVLAQLEADYHAALNGGKREITARNNTWELFIKKLDAIALYLESECIETPDKLLASGFNLTQGRKNNGGKRSPMQVAKDFCVENMPEQGKARGSASQIKGAYNHELHYCRALPSIEASWMHKGMFMDITDMVMEGLEAGDLFFRMRSYGPDGAGPWSGIVTTTIT